MIKNNNKLLIILIMTTLFSYTLFGNNSPETIEIIESTKAENNSSNSYPIVITHAYGKTVINKKPVRVATISWGNHDVPLALNVVPVGVSRANYGVEENEMLLPWTADKIKELGANNMVIYDDIAGLNYEAISDSNPDIILAAYSGITQEEYDLLSEIAPVVAYPKQAWQTLWREQATMNSKGMGLETEGLKYVKKMENLIIETLQKYPEISGKSAAFFYFNPADLGKFYIYIPTDARAAYLLDLGLTFPQAVEDILDEDSSFAIELSAENVDILYDLDIIFTYGNQDLLNALQNDALVGTIPAVKNNAIVLIENNSSLAASCTPSLLSIPATIDEYLSMINEAAVKVK